MAPWRSAVLPRLDPLLHQRDRGGRVDIGEDPQRLGPRARAGERRGAAGGVGPAGILQGVEGLQRLGAGPVGLVAVGGESGQVGAGLLEAQAGGGFDGRGPDRVRRPGEDGRELRPQRVGGRRGRPRRDRPPEAHDRVTPRGVRPRAQHLQRLHAHRRGQVGPAGRLDQRRGVLRVAPPQAGVEHAVQQRQGRGRRHRHRGQRGLRTVDRHVVDRPRGLEHQPGIGILQVPGDLGIAEPPHRQQDAHPRRR